MKQPFRKITEEEHKILFHIGFTILQYYKHDYKKAYTCISKIGINDIKYKKSWLFRFNKKSTIHLNMERPGIFIGHRGELIAFITEELKKQFKQNMSIRVWESKISTWLYPVDYSNEEF